MYFLGFLPMMPVNQWDCGQMERHLSVFQVSLTTTTLQKFTFFKTVTFKHFFLFLVCLLPPFVISFIDFEPLNHNRI